MVHFSLIHRTPSVFLSIKPQILRIYELHEFDMT
jgi:hypothetical protein